MLYYALSAYYLCNRTVSSSLPHTTTEQLQYLSALLWEPNKSIVNSLLRVYYSLEDYVKLDTTLSLFIAIYNDTLFLCTPFCMIPMLSLQFASFSVSGQVDERC